MGQGSTCILCCGGGKQLFQKFGYWIDECESCGHRYARGATAAQHTAVVYDDGYFTGGGAGYPDYVGSAPLLVAQGKRYARLLAPYMAPGTVLDVGSAAGFLLKGLVESGWRGEGVEPNPSMADHARSRYALQVHTGSLEQFRTSNRYDMVTMIQVIAHLYDVRRALQAAADVTKPGGYWLVETSDRSSFIARMLGRHWHAYDPPSVLHYFSPGSLSALVGQYGFREVARGKPVKWLRGDHAKSVIRHKLEGSRLKWVGKVVQSVIPNEMPIRYPNFDTFWALYRKQS